jgi:uncharacterized repeat protein (TIGR03803 family)
MKIRIVRWSTLTVISLLSFLSLAAQAGAQDTVSKQPNGSPTQRARTGSTHKATSAGTATGYTVLYSFCSAANCTDGLQPLAGLIQDAAGNLYGTTDGGGANGRGTVFMVDSTGQETVLHSFSGGTDGEGPLDALVMDAAGNLYGTTLYGGAGANCVGKILSCGTVFKLDTTGNETVIYSFCSAANCADGYEPEAGLILDAAGSLYGTTNAGGANPYGGTVFKIDTTGHETVLYSFCSASNCTDGNDPGAGLIQDAAGNLYGTTSQGGAGGFSCQGCGGTLFKLLAPAQPGGNWTETVLYSFCSAANCTDGNLPLANLVQDAAGNIYGTTIEGGANTSANGGYGGGTVYKVNTAGQETVLYSFCSVTGCADGNGPFGLIQDASGNLYGTTGTGGAHNSGTVFKVNSSGQETVLYSFCSAPKCTDGYGPYNAGVIQDASGNLYGTTYRGGANSGTNGGNGSGVAFKLAPTVSVTLTSSLNPSYVDEPVTLSAVVSGSEATPTGSVTFVQGKTTLGTATVVNGEALLITTFMKSGSLSTVADYSGDQDYQATNSKPITQVVEQYTTSTALASNLNPSTYGQSVTWTATVSSAGGPIPTGTVTFKNGTATLGTTAINIGVATITKSTLSAGTSTITASYNGDAASKKSTSPALQQVVGQATSTTTILSSVNPSNVGQTVKFTATVTSPTTKPTGTVTFMDGSTVLGTGTIAAGTGKASFSTSSLSEGSHNITAVYAGNANVIGSTSPTLVQVVN